MGCEWSKIRRDLIRLVTLGHATSTTTNTAALYRCSKLRIMKVPTKHQLLIFKSGVAPVMSPVLDNCDTPECRGWIVAGVSSNFSPDCLPRMSLVPHKLGHKAPPSFVRNIGHLQHSPLSADEFSIFPSQRQTTSGIVLPSF